MFAAYAMSILAAILFVAIGAAHLLAIMIIAGVPAALVTFRHLARANPRFRSSDLAVDPAFTSTTRARESDLISRTP
ncbi:hypothetical protein [Cellulosimicrobium sp. CUA-896]|uniref:hypothetical protein n=1 Tax=Cellulosimicrobium sp. CUA-896 TaxID=1517881 RepID=UPI00095B23BE|nr:hypothetical protein [Cellulosimicrobium sp. CUA-896]OLT53977.1 hypothetical protein BJF88_00280 [Cellulosimicrobium sp. CUA-896]